MIAYRPSAVSGSAIQQGPSSVQGKADAVLHFGGLASLRHFFVALH